MKYKPDPEQLVAENQDLHDRLAKAEVSLREILGGEAEALFVSGMAGTQLFALKGTDQSYRALIENMREGALTLTPQGLVLYANRCFAGMLKSPLEKVIGSEIQHWLAPESWQVVQELLQKQGSDNYHEELYITAADGALVPVYLSVSHLVLNEMPDSVCMVVTDLTEQKRNKAILAEEILARTILDQAADGIVICDEKGRIIRASKKAQEFLGKSPVGKLFDHAFPLHNFDGSAFPSIDLINAEQRLSVEALLNYAGLEHNLLVSIGRLKNSHEELLGSVVTLTDITERKLAELALKKNEKQLTEALTIARMGYWIYETATDEFILNDQYFLLHNMTVAEAGGYRVSSADFVRRFLSPDSEAIMPKDMQLALTRGNIRHSAVTEARILTAAGELKWVEVRHRTQQDLQGKTTHMVGIVQDIDSRKLEELKLRESERRFSDMLENLQLISIMLDREARITYCNDYLLHLTGWQRDEVIGNNWWDQFVPPEIRYLRNDFFASLLNNESQGLHHENDIVTRSGENRLIRWNNSVLRSGTGEVIGAASIGEDVTERKQAIDKLAANEVVLQEFIRHTPAAIAMLDTQMRYLQTSERWMQDYKIVGQDIIGKSHYEIFPEIDQRWKDIYQRILGGAIEHCDEDSFVRADGSTDWLQWEARPWYLSQDKIGGIIFFTQVITERKKAEASIAHLNRVLHVLSSINSLIVRVVDRDELFREACNIAVEAGGLRMAMIVIVDPATLLPVSITSAGKSDELLAEIKAILSSSEGMQKTLVGQVIRENKAVIANDTQNDTRLVFGKLYTKAGVKSMTVLPLSITGKALGVLALYASEIGSFQQDEMQLLTELAGNIAFATDHINKQERLNYLAYYDVLTGLANRTSFHERLQKSVAMANEQGRTVAVILLDIERFKTINDTLGRDAGDTLLRKIAARMLDNATDASRLARIDADHFAVLVQNSGNREEVASLIKKHIAEVFARPFLIGESELRITAKIGISLFPDDGTDADTLFKNAEVALKKSKTTGKQCLFYRKEMNAASAGKLAMENKLRQAIEKNEFVLHYQPKVNMVTGNVTSAEALIRWNDPRTGLVAPNKFIPILEETGMIYEVGRWALYKAIEDNRHWRDAGRATVRIAVNVSPLQLRNGNFADEIRQLVSLDKLSASGLELEITESLIMENVKYSITSLQVIRALGVTIAIDDFGTGFSSLNYLSKLPIDTLKIDRTFVIGMDTPEGVALVSTIIILAHALQLTVVAEGVETEKQSRQLLALNCDEMQGFLFSRPVPADIFAAKFLGPLTMGKNLVKRNELTGRRADNP